jgi:hypothetical protein
LRAAPAPVALDVLAGHLRTIRLPERTTALLDRVGTGGPFHCPVNDPDAPDGRAASGRGDFDNREACASDGVVSADAVDSSTASGSFSLEILVVDLLAERLTRLLDGIFDATVQPDMTALTRALSGLGPGLTPTGDDLLVGVAAACRRLVAGGFWPATRRDVLFAVLAEMGDTGTTSVAREMVGRAAVGQFPEVLTGFVELLGDRNARADQVQAATGRLAAIGAHSGADMLAGVVALAARACREGTTR